MRPTNSNASRLWQIGAILLVAILYFATLPKGLPDFDAAEFIVIAQHGGIAHPPGYPLYVLFLRGAAWLGSQLPLVPVLAGLSVLFSLISVWLMFALVEALTSSSSLAFASTVAVFLSAPVWRCSTTIEPFALNLLLAALVLTCVYRLVSETLHSNRRTLLVVLGLLFGFGFCNHHTLVFVLPLTFYSIWVTRRNFLNDALEFIGGFLLGLAPLLYFLLGKNGLLVWGDWSHFFQRLIVHLFRREYGTFSLATGQNESWYRAPLYLFRLLSQSLPHIYLAAILFEVFSLLKNKTEDTHKKIFGWGMIVAVLLSGPLMFSLFHLGTGLADVPTMDRFSALPIFLLAPLVALGLMALKKKLFSTSAFALLIFGMLAFHGIVQYPIAERRSEVIYEQYTENLLRIAAKNSVIFGFGDLGFYACIYGRYALGLRSDIDCINSAMLSSPWYQQQLISRFGKRSDVFSLSALFSQRPTYSTEPSSWLRYNVPNAYPFGVLIKIPGPEGVPNANQLVAINENLYRNVLKLPSDSQIKAAKPWERMVLWNYGVSWETLANLLAPTDKKLAEICLKRARVFGAPPDRFY